MQDKIQVSELPRFADSGLSLHSSPSLTYIPVKAIKSFSLLFWALIKIWKREKKFVNLLLGIAEDVLHLISNTINWQEWIDGLHCSFSTRIPNVAMEKKIP